MKPPLVKALDKYLCFGLDHLVSPKYFSIGTFLFTSLAACLLYVTVCAHQSNDNDSAHTYVFLVDDNKIFKIERKKIEKIVDMHRNTSEMNKNNLIWVRTHFGYFDPRFGVIILLF